MLDFYLISDDHLSYDLPNEKLFIGSIKLEDYKNLELFNINQETHNLPSFFKDSRMNSLEVKTLLRSVETLNISHTRNLKTRHSKAEESLNKLKLILRAAAEKDLGLFSFCD